MEGIKTKWRWWPGSVLLACLACGQNGTVHGSGAGVPAGPAGTQQDHGGPVIASARVVPVWWGDQASFGDTVAEMERFLRTLNGSPWLGVLDQYLRGEKARVAFGGHLFLSGGPSAPQPGLSEVMGAVCRAISAAGASPDPSGIYLLFTDTPPGSEWGWHGYGECRGTLIGVAWIARVAYPAPCSTASPESHGALQVAAHELAEIMTNPFAQDAWIAGDGREVADGCPLMCQQIAGAGYTLPSLWSNEEGRCVPP